MRVGVFLDDRSPTTGGGFSFQDSILQALLSLRTHHDLYLFCTGQELPPHGPHINVVTAVDRWPKGVVGKAVRVVRGVRREMYRKLGKEIDTPLKGLLREHGIQILWFPTPAGEETDIPYIFTVWDLQHRCQPFFPEVGAPTIWRRTEALYENMVPRASFVITGTNAGKREIVGLYRIPEERVRVIELPVPTFSLVNDDQVFPDEDFANRKYLFYPAQFWPHKNHVVLLYALKMLKKDFNLDFELIFTGSDQGNLSYVRSVAEDLGMQNSVRFLGFVDKTTLVRLYRGAFALVFPSLFGPDNLPPLEAFALGCPVIAGNIPGSEEQLGDAALLVDAKDEREICRAVALLSGSPRLRRELIERGMLRANRWSAKDYVEAVMKIVDDFESTRRCWGV